MADDEIEVRVRYGETDQMGVVYHANYFLYFEIGRTEFLRSHGITYKKLEEEGIFLVVTQLSCRYYSPARYDDLIRVRTELCEVGNVKLKFIYSIYRSDDNKLLAQGETTLGCIGKNRRPLRLPEKIIKSLIHP